MARELNLGGSERQMTEIAHFLDRSQFDPRVGCFVPAGIRGEELRAAGVPVVHFPVHSFKSPTMLSGAAQLVRYIRSERIDLVHTFDFPMNVFAIPVTRLFTSAVALSSQRSHRQLNSPGYTKMLRLSDRLAHGVVVNCRFLERHMIDDEGVPPEHVNVCFNGIDLESFVSRQGVREGPLVIGVVANLLPWKGLSTLLDAFARIRNIQPGLRLVIVGSGPELANLQLRATENVVFQPGTAAIAEQLREMDIFVLPSLSEAFSNALMEAMACGCCAVASNVGGNPELVRNGETGMLFEAGNTEALADVLSTLVMNAGLRRELAIRGTRFIRENYSIQNASLRMAEIYAAKLPLRARRKRSPQLAANSASESESPIRTD